MLGFECFSKYFLVKQCYKVEQVTINKKVEIG